MTHIPSCADAETHIRRSYEDLKDGDFPRLADYADELVVSWAQERLNADAEAALWAEAAQDESFLAESAMWGRA